MGLLRVTLVTLLLFGLYEEANAQQYLVLDRYGTKRIRLPLGSEVTYSLKGDDRIYRNYITQLTDSIVIMGNNDVYLKLDEFDSFYFDRALWTRLRQGTTVIAAGFFVSAAVHPLVDDPFYDQSESAVIGLFALGIGQSFRLLERKRFRLKKNSRIWVGGWP